MFAHGSPYSYFRWCGYFWSPWVSFVTTDDFSVRVTKIISRVRFSWTHSLPFYFNLFKLNELWRYYQKHVNQIILNQITLKVSFTNIRGLHSDFVDCESFLESNSPGILALCETNLDDSIDSGNFSVRRYLPLIGKDSSAHMHCLIVYVKERLPFARGFSQENSIDSYLCFWLALLHSVSYFFFLCRSPSWSLCKVFDSVTSNIDEALSINPSANVFVFEDFNFHHKDWEKSEASFLGNFWKLNLYWPS